MIGTLAEDSRPGSGLATVYRALEVVVEGHGLADAVLVLDVPGLGRQVLRAGRRPLGDDDARLLGAPEGLYTAPPLEGPTVTVVEELLVALGRLALAGERAGGQAGEQLVTR